MEAADTDTFKQIAEEYLDKLRGEGRARMTMKKVEWLLSLAYSDIGAKGIAKVSPADVLAPKITTLMAFARRRQ